MYLSFFLIIGELLDFCERYQQKWTFLSRIFNEMSISSRNIELVSFCIIILIGYMIDMAVFRALHVLLITDCCIADREVFPSGQDVS